MMAPTDDETALELRLAIQKTARRIRNERGGDHVSDGWLSVLGQLDRGGPATAGQLAEYDHVTPPSMTRTITALREAGYVTTAPSEDDGRRVIVSITDAGHALMDETRRLRTVWFREQLADLSGDERAALQAALPVLRKMADS